MFTSLATWFRRQPVRRKLTATVLSTSAVTLIAGCVVFATYDYIDARSRLVRDVTLLADMLGTNSIAPLTFNDATAAAETLRATAVNEHIESARLYLPQRLAAGAATSALGSTVPADHDRALLARADARGLRRRPSARRAADRPRPRRHRHDQRPVRHLRDLGPREALHRHRGRHGVRRVLARARPVACHGAADLPPYRAADRRHAPGARQRALRRARRARRRRRDRRAHRAVQRHAGRHREARPAAAPAAGRPRAHCRAPAPPSCRPATSS